MHRFYLPPAECNADQLTLTDREAHHALHVLRVRLGENVVVLDGAGRQLGCTVQQVSKAALTLRVQSRVSIPALPWSLTLVQAIPKAKIIETIIQKATELGASRVVPLLSERVVTQVDSDSAAQKAAKWQQVAIEAIKQSGNAWMPTVEPPITPRQFLARGERHDLAVIGSLREGSKHFREHMEAYVREHGQPPRTVCVWVGPEGDFTSGEYDAAEQAGALPISLGRLVLRSETAATCCLATLSYELRWHHQQPGS
jgi:16S rRNA (uracil1498-N3)-methyltransferase